MKHRLFQLTAISIMLLPFSADASQDDRASLITESFFAQKEDEREYRPSNYNPYGKRKSNQIWHKILVGMGIPNSVPDNQRWRDRCNTNTALSILEGIRQELGENTAYQKVWAENQNRVCQKIEPRITADETLPIRAYSDYKYQMGSFYFYNRDYKSALSAYKEVEAIKDAPLRPFAIYMIVRTLSYLDRKEEAYTKTSAILENKHLKSIHEMVKNYRFILTYDSWYHDESFTVELAEIHLKWLLEMILVDPSKSKNLDQSYADYFDALAHLDRYFPLLEKKSKRVDWWLQDGNIETPRMSTVKKLAPEYEIVDWMQSSWAYNVFDDDWLWALHEKDNKYWTQNENIVQHAWKRWKNSDGLEWLEIAIKRVHPSNTLSHDILKNASPYLLTPFDNETREYKAWLQNIWVNSIRLHIAHNEFESAYNLYDSPIYKDFDSDNIKWYQNRSTLYKRDLSKVLRWLVYNGETEEARKFLASAIKKHPYYYIHWQVLLAQSWSNNITTHTTKNNIYNVINPTALWQKMVNVASTKELYKLAKNDSIKLEYRKILSRVILTRAMLLEDKQNIDKYAQLTASQNRPIREEILKAVEKRNPNDYTHFILRTPRLRTVPFTMLERNFGLDEENDPTKIDIYDHSDNNWWCNFNYEQLENDVFLASRINLNGGHSIFNLTSNKTTSENNHYNQNVYSILKEHPYHDLVDMSEIRALENIPSAPRYLNDVVVKNEKWKGLQFWRGKDSKNESASNLHHAIKTTRYGCELDGSHGEYSQKSFKILHDRYGDTIWSKVTPYWFSDKHFRKTRE